MRQIDRRLHVHVLDVDQLRFVTWPDRLPRSRAGGGQNVVLMTGAGSGILKTWRPAGARTAACAPPSTCTT
jgi:hypothetical protein